MSLPGEVMGSSFLMATRIACRPAYASSPHEGVSRLFARDAFAAAWSPDGSHLAYQKEPENDFNFRFFMKPLVLGDETEIEIDRKELYSFATDLDWLNCP